MGILNLYDTKITTKIREKIMSKFIYSFFVISILILLYGCTGGSTSAYKGVDLGGKKIGMIDT